MCLKMLCTPKPNGFHDHYPYEKWLAIIGNINPRFSVTNPHVKTVQLRAHEAALGVPWLSRKLVSPVMC